MVKSPPSNAGDAGSVPGELGSMCHGAAKLECCGGSLWATTDLPHFSNEFEEKLSMW